MTEETNQPEMSDEEALMKIAQAMKDNAPTQDEKQNVHSFLVNVVQAIEIDKIIKTGNLRDDKEMNELGHPTWNVRGCLEMARISDKIIENDFFTEYFEAAAKETTSSSLSRDGFIIKQATTQTKQVADVTRRRRIKKGWLGGQKIEESGGDTTQPTQM